jgi:hypothetical protein
MQRRSSPALEASLVGVMRVESDLTVPAWQWASVIESGVAAGLPTAWVHGPRGTILLRNSSPPGRWIEPEASRTDLVLLVSAQGITVVRVTDSIQPDKHRLDFQAFARELPLPGQVAFDSLQRWTSQFCPATDSTCPRALQVHLHAPMSSVELLALLDAAAPARAADQFGRRVQVTFVARTLGGRSQSLPLFVIQRVIQQREASLRGCYEQALVRDPRLSGRVLMKLTVDQDGVVSDVKDVSDDQRSASADGRPTANQPLSDRIARQCMAERFRTLLFPPPPGGALTVSWPMFFSPGPREQVSEELQ